MAAAEPTLAAQLGIRAGDVVALLGGGGKTSLMFALAGQLGASGLRALCTTTTKMMEPRTPQDCDACIVNAALDAAVAETTAAFTSPGRRLVLAAGYAAAHPGAGREGAAARRRIDGVPPAWPRRLIEAGACDVVLVEADGARKLPFKAPAEHEPVLPDGTSVAVAVAGVDALGRPLAEDFVCRAAVVAKATGLELGAEVTAPAMGCVLGSRAVWRVPPDVRHFAACVNKADGGDDAKLEAASGVAQEVVAQSNGCAQAIVTGEVGGSRGVVRAYFECPAPE
eukprot:COSAG04_NODE_527_length_13079_cov_26.785516_4_plen_282_part_00